LDNISFSAQHDHNCDVNSNNNKMEKEGSYKIISIKKKHPIFICKAIPTKSPPVLDPLPPPVHQSPQFTLLKHQLQKATEHIQPLKTPKI